MSKPVNIAAATIEPKKASSKDGPELSEEDQRIKSEVDLLVTRSGDSDSGLAGVACKKLAELLQTVRAGSAASVPKPLKFLRPHFETLAANAERSSKPGPVKSEENASTLYDILSFVSMTRQSTEEREKEEAKERAEREAKEKEEKKREAAAKAAGDIPQKKSGGGDNKNKNKGDAGSSTGGGGGGGDDEQQGFAPKKEIPFVPNFECINMKLKGHPGELSQWGYEYVRHLGGDLVKLVRADDDPSAVLSQRSDLHNIVKRVVAYLMEHQDEPTAVDIAMETNALSVLQGLVDGDNVDRVCPYLLAIAQYIASEAEAIYDFAFELYLRLRRHCLALRVAFMMPDAAKSGEAVQKVFEVCQDPRVKMQLATMCGAVKSTFATPDGDADLDALIGNEKQSDFYRKVGEALDAKAPKAPADIFKEHVMDKHLVPQVANSHIHNLATSFVSGFANAGFGDDTLVGGTAGDSWIFQTKEHRQMSAVGCVGMLHMWDHEEGFNDIMRFNMQNDNNIKAGVLLSTGIISCGIRVPFDPAFSVLSEAVTDANREMRVAAIVGLGLAYSGTKRDDIKDLLIPLVVDGSQTVETQALAAHALGLIFVGTADDDVCESVLMCLMDKTEVQIKEPTIRYLVLALGLLVLRCKDRADGMIEATKTLHPSLARYTEIVVMSCAHCATGSVLMVQKLLHIIAEKPAEEDDDGAEADAAAAAAAAGGEGDGKDGKKEQGGNKKAAKEAPMWSHKSAALLGVALVSLGEEVGMSLIKRGVHHVLLSKEDTGSSGRRGLPLALALLSVSDPQMSVIDTLSKLSHDSDTATAQAAIIGMGIAAAGSNNARVATLLRNLSGYYHKDMSMLFIVRLAQGLISLGKGHITVSPFRFDRSLISTVSLSGILSFIHTAMDCEKTVLGDYHFMAFSLCPAMAPRHLFTINDKLEKVDAHVRIGTPVDTVAVAGKPKTITGFQTQMSPVLLQEGERAELVPGKSQTLEKGVVLEGVVVIEPRKEVVEETTAAAVTAD